MGAAGACQGPRQSKWAANLAYWPLPLFLVLAGLGIVSLVPGWPYNIGQVYTPPRLRPTDGGRRTSQAGRCSPIPSPATSTTCHGLAVGRRLPVPHPGRRGERRQRALGGHRGSIQHLLAGRCAKMYARLPLASCPGPGRLRHLAGRAVVVIPLTNSVNPMCAVRFVEAVLGGLAVYERSAAVWTNVDPDPELTGLEARTVSALPSYVSCPRLALGQRSGRPRLSGDLDADLLEDLRERGADRERRAVPGDGATAVDGDAGSTSPRRGRPGGSRARRPGPRRRRARRARARGPCPRLRASSSPRAGRAPSTRPPCP